MMYKYFVSETFIHAKKLKMQSKNVAKKCIAQQMMCTRWPRVTLNNIYYLCVYSKGISLQDYNLAILEIKINDMVTAMSRLVRYCCRN